MNTKNNQIDYENHQPNSQNLHNHDNQQSKQNPNGYQNRYNNPPNYNPHYPYGNQPYEYQNNQNEFDMRLVSTAKISIVYITLYILSVFFFFIACILVVTSATGFNVNLDQIFAAIGLFCVGGVFCFVNFILSIILAVKVNVLSKFSRKFSTPFILFVIGIFFNLLSFIASFMTLSGTKNTKDTQPNSQNLHNQDNQQSQQNPYDNQPYRQQQPYGYQNNQKIFEKQSTSTANISIACISFYFVSVVSLLFGCVTIGVNLINQSVYYSQGIYYQYILSGTTVAYLVIGCISWLVNFILTIMLVLKVNDLNKFSTEFSTPFIFFIIGIFFNLFSVIAAFMILPIIKKAKQPILNHD